MARVFAPRSVITLSTKDKMVSDGGVGKGSLLPAFVVLDVLSNIMHGDCENNGVARLIEQLYQRPKIHNDPVKRDLGETVNILELLIVLIVQLSCILLPEIHRFVNRRP